MIEACHGQPSRATVRAFVDPADEATALADIDRIELELAGEARALPGARALLASLPPGRWGVVHVRHPGPRDRPAGRVRDRSRRRCSSRRTTSSNGKPNPDGYLLALARLGADPATSVVVEDAPTGIAAARAAGVGTVIGVGERAVGADVDVVVADLACRAAGTAVGSSCRGDAPRLGVTAGRVNERGGMVQIG